MRKEFSARKRRTRRRQEEDWIYEHASSGIFSSHKFFGSLKRRERRASLFLFLLLCEKRERVTQKFRHAKGNIEYIFLQAELTRQSFSLLVGEKFFISRLRKNFICEISICQKRAQILLESSYPLHIRKIHYRGIHTVGSEFILSFLRIRYSNFKNHLLYLCIF